MPYTLQDKSQVESEIPDRFWTADVTTLLDRISGSRGLTQRAAEQRLREFGPNTVSDAERGVAFSIAVDQLKSPLILILIGASLVSMIVGEWLDATIILAIVGLGAILGFSQEYVAGNIIRKLQARITFNSLVERDGRITEIPSSETVPGDIVHLSAGSLVPGDGLVIESKDLYLNQSALTGETFPSEKSIGVCDEDSTIVERTNSLFMGTSVTSGTGKMLVVRTGSRTEFGELSSKLTLRPTPTDFEKGVTRFGLLLSRIMLVMVLVVITINLALEKPPIDSLLFALALAVGLAPEMLPAILTLNLSHGAKRMAGRGVIVRKLNSIENLGSMQVLCTDKTGTMTMGVIRLDSAMDVTGVKNVRIASLAAVNSALQSGLQNPLDDAVLSSVDGWKGEIESCTKVDEIPFDFERKCLSVVVMRHGTTTLISKGALDNILSRCTTFRDDSDNLSALDETKRREIGNLFIGWSQQGFRVLGVASAEVESKAVYSIDDERDLTFEGFLLFMDPPKPDALKTIEELALQGVAVKVITGDNRNISRHFAQMMGLDPKAVLTGREIRELGDMELAALSEKTTIFAEVDPSQKERIIKSIQSSGLVVGYMGDGINDALALRTADIGISVNTAVDVAKSAADFVLLEKNLDTLREGIIEGRTTFINTMKYILTTMSANLGNMVSMAVASLSLPFLPLTAGQILLNNFLSDVPATGIAADNVDRDWLEKPRRWNTKGIRNFMIVFGLTSAIFDFMTFGSLIWIFDATVQEFQTGWFIESLLTELVAALVVRTKKPFFRSRPANFLLYSSIALAIVAFATPFIPGASYFGFTPLSPTLLIWIGFLTMLYVLVLEIVKSRFFPKNSI